jgi:hypothetical protein
MLGDFVGIYEQSGGRPAEHGERASPYPRLPHSRWGGGTPFEWLIGAAYRRQAFVFRLSSTSFMRSLTLWHQLAP